MTSYVKIYGNQLLRSTVWVNTDKETKLVWITMLSIADKHGLVLTSIPGLAKDAGVTIEECERSLKVLSSPDPYSRTKKYEGRRVEDIDGGFILLNYKKYRDMRTETQVKEAERKAEWRAKPRSGYVYYAGDADRIKIGFSKNPWARVNEMKTALPGLQILATEVATLDDERALHEQFAPDLIEREWFRASPALAAHVKAVSDRSGRSSNRSDSSATTADVPSSPVVSRATPTPSPTPSPKETTNSLVKMDLVPTRDRSIVAKSIVDSLEQIGQIAIAKKELTGLQVLAVFAYWVKKMGKDNARTKLSLGRWARLEKYLKLYDVETCLYAIDGALIHPHANQENGKTFHEFPEIFMNKPEGPDRVEKLSEYAREKDRHPKHRFLEKHPELEGLT